MTSQKSSKAEVMRHLNEKTFSTHRSTGCALSGHLASPTSCSKKALGCVGGRVLLEKEDPLLGFRRAGDGLSFKF